MKSLLFTCGLVLVTTWAVAECQPVTIDGEEKMLCDAGEADTYGDLDERDVWGEGGIWGNSNSSRGVFPTMSYRNGNLTVTDYNDGTNCITTPINAQGLTITNCN